MLLVEAVGRSEDGAFASGSLRSRLNLHYYAGLGFYSGSGSTSWAFS